MITITNTTKEFTAVERYLMTTAPTIKTVKNLSDGDVINVAGYLEFIDEKRTVRQSSLCQLSRQRILSTVHNQ